MRQFNNEFFPSFYSCLYSYMCVCVRRGKNVNNVGEEKEVCRGEVFSLWGELVGLFCPTEGS